MCVKDCVCVKFTALSVKIAVGLKLNGEIVLVLDEVILTLLAVTRPSLDENVRDVLHVCVKFTAEIVAATDIVFVADRMLDRLLVIETFAAETVWATVAVSV
eukprot:PhM_4_TR8464/c1_g1_i3/m.79100